MYCTSSAADLHEQILNIDHVVGLLAGGHVAGEASVHADVVVATQVQIHGLVAVSAHHVAQHKGDARVHKHRLLRELPHLQQPQQVAPKQRHLILGF
jgi:hypothetical protein